MKTRSWNFLFSIRSYSVESKSFNCGFNRIIIVQQILDAFFPLTFFRLHIYMNNLFYLLALKFCICIISWYPVKNSEVAQDVINFSYNQKWIVKESKPSRADMEKPPKSMFDFLVKKERMWINCAVNKGELSADLMKTIWWENVYVSHWGLEVWLGHCEIWPETWSREKMTCEHERKETTKTLL